MPHLISHTSNNDRTILIKTIILAACIVTSHTTHIKAHDHIKDNISRELLNNADTVFIGKVLEITKSKYNGKANVRFQVYKTWKGTKRSFTTVQANYEMEGCEIEMKFKTSLKYIIYAKYRLRNWIDDSAYFWTNFCLGTNLLPESDRSIDVID